ncbi:hypothetical protein AAG906_039859 [Vitis piasezkii]
MFVPRNIQESFDDPNWKVAVMEEINALKRSGSWELVDLPKEKRTVGCKWIFIVKCKVDGSIERYKARLGAKGFTQTYGINYRETFASMAKISSIRILLSFVVNFNWPLHQLDIRNAFLNGDPKEEVFMNLPPEFEEKLGSNKVCNKKNPNMVSNNLLELGLRDLEKLRVGEIEKKTFNEFEIKDLGALKYFLGMEFSRFKESIQPLVAAPLLEVTCHLAKQKHNMVARNSAEVEFRSVALRICKVLLIRQLLEELKISRTLPMKLYCDNKATISIAHNLVLHDRTKHVEVNKHFIKEKLESGLICMPYIPTTEQVANVLTKGIPTKQFDRLIDKLAMEDIFKPT